MKELDNTVGERLQEKLCPACRKTLNKKLKRWHLFAPTRLYTMIMNNTCIECQLKIMEAGNDNIPDQ